MSNDVKLEQAVAVCPQCEGEGGYADGLDEAACRTECTRCAGNGWIVDLAELTRHQPQREAVLGEAELNRLAGRVCEIMHYEDGRITRAWAKQVVRELATALTTPTPAEDDDPDDHLGGKTEHGGSK